MPTVAPLQIWQQFKGAFQKALDEAGPQKLTQAWQHVRNKTAFYEQLLMPAIAKHLRLEFQIERLRCDYTFLSIDGVPLVAVEAENCHGTASKEIDSLCSLAAPVKVLVLSCSWEDTEEQKFRPKWIEVIKAHHSLVSVDCIYAIIVGEWQEEGACMIRYSFTPIEPNGTVHQKTYHEIAQDQKQLSASISR